MASCRTGLRLAWGAARPDLLLVLALHLASCALAAAQVVMASAAIGVVGGEPATVETAALLLGLAATVGAQAVLAAAYRERQRVIGELVAYHAQHRILTAAAQTDLARFEESVFHDELQRAQVTAEVRPAQLAAGLLTLSAGMVAAVGVWVGLLVLSVPVAVVVGATVAPMWWMTRRGNDALYRLAYRFTGRDRMRLYVADLLVGRDEAAEIRAYRLGPRLLRRFGDLYQERIAETRHIAWRRFAYQSAAGLTTTALLGVAVGVTLWLVNRAILTVPMAAAAIAAVAMLAQRLAAVADGASDVHEATLFLRDYQDFLDSQPTRSQSPTTEPVREVRARSVTFAYPSATRLALDHVDFVVRRGEIVAIVGENGSGKTTLAKLLMGLYQPDAGQVCWDQRDAAELLAADIRPDAAMMFQDHVRYRFTIAETISALADQAEEARLRHAAGDAGLDALLAELPDGLFTGLGPEHEGGRGLSGGQWQRLALARLYYQDAGLVILDEPTAALDPVAERRFFERIRTVLADRAVVVISHRLAYVAAADRIYIMRGGRVVATGSHRDLVNDDTDSWLSSRNRDRQ